MPDGGAPASSSATAQALVNAACRSLSPLTGKAGPIASPLDGSTARKLSADSRAARHSPAISNGWTSISAPRAVGDGGTDLAQRGFALGAFQHQARRAHALAAQAYHFLREFDQLHELGHGVHAQRRQEPGVEVGGVFHAARLAGAL